MPHKPSPLCLSMLGGGSNPGGGGGEKAELTERLKRRRAAEARFQIEELGAFLAQCFFHILVDGDVSPAKTVDRLLGIAN